MLRDRLISGVMLGAALLVAAFFLPPAGVLAVLLAVVWLSMREFYALLDARETPHFKRVGMFCGLALILGTWLANRYGCPRREAVEPVLLFLTLAVVFVRQLFHTRTNRPWDTMGGTLLGVFYVAFLFNFIVKLLTEWPEEQGRMLALFLVFVVKFTDIGAFFVGCAVGRHKLLPRISPAKTWEGVVGGLLCGVGAGLAFAQVAGDRLPLRGETIWVISVVLAVSGVIGDLIESLLKRASGVKDSGTMIQGMGGWLDVVDSVIFSAPVLYAAALFAAR